MNLQAQRAGDLEAAFLAGVEANLNRVKGTRLPGSAWSWMTRSDEEHLRELMAKAGRFDRDLLARLPKGTTRFLTGRRPFLFFKGRPTSIAIASVMVDLDALIADAAPPEPVGPAALTDHVRSLVHHAGTPHLIGVFSPFGFSEEVQQAGLELPNVRLILIEPDEAGYFRVRSAGRETDPDDLALFNPESTDHQAQRIREAVASHGATLRTGGLSAEALSRELAIPVERTREVVEAIAEADPTLRLSKSGSDRILYRGAVEHLEDDAMSMAEWMRQLFSRKGEEARKINTLSERRAKLTQQRDRLYEDLGQIEAKERALLREGRDTSSPAVKKRVATQIKMLRDDMDRLNASARMVGQQIEVLSTHIHNLSLIQQGKQAKLPETQEITDDAVRAEEMLEQLGSDVELTSGLAMGTGEASMSDEELSILAELDQPADETESADEPGAKSPDTEAAPPTPLAEPAETESEKPRGREPEAG